MIYLKKQDKVLATPKLRNNSDLKTQLEGLLSPNISKDHNLQRNSYVTQLAPTNEYEPKFYGVQTITYQNYKYNKVARRPIKDQKVNVTRHPGPKIGLEHYVQNVQTQKSSMNNMQKEGPKLFDEIAGRRVITDISLNQSQSQPHCKKGKAPLSIIQIDDLPEKRASVGYLVKGAKLNDIIRRDNKDNRREFSKSIHDDASVTTKKKVQIQTKKKEMNLNSLNSSPTNDQDERIAAHINEWKAEFEDLCVSSQKLYEELEYSLDEKSLMSLRSNTSKGSILAIINI